MDSLRHSLDQNFFADPWQKFSFHPWIHFQILPFRYAKVFPLETPSIVCSVSFVIWMVSRTSLFCVVFVFLLNKITDLDLFIICPEHLSYKSRISYNYWASPPFSRINNKESSTNNRCDTLGALWQTFTPTIWSSYQLDATKQRNLPYTAKKIGKQWVTLS